MSIKRPASFYNTLNWVAMGTISESKKMPAETDVAPKAISGLDWDWVWKSPGTAMLEHRQC